MSVNSAMVDVQNRVFSVVKEVLAIDDDSARLDASLKEDLGASSLDRLTLFLALQDEFGGSVSVDEVEGMSTLRDIVNYIRKRVEYGAVAE